MFDSSHYVPVLKSKAGELSALADLTAETRDGMTPLLEVTAEKKNLKTGERQPLEEHVAKISDKISRAWPTSAPIFVDFVVDPTRQLANGRTISEELFARLRENVGFVPVTKLGASIVHQDSVRDAIRADRRGVCVRIDDEDFLQTRTLRARLHDLMRFLRVQEADVDLVLDLKDVEATHVAAAALTARAVLELLRVSGFRTLTLVSAAFPHDLGGCKRNSTTRIERADWRLWQTLAADASELPRLPTYGDYGITHPELIDFDPTKMRMSAAIRYTSETEWVIVKGSAIDVGGWQQTADLSARLVNTADFRGASFSWGDDYIARRARSVATAGNATTWRRVGTTHHLTLVTTQLASRSGP
jgi:hypothetical protein